MRSEVESQKILSEAIQQALHSDDAADAQGNLVVGWVVVAESMDPDGGRWLSRIDGSPGGGRLSAWTREGLLFNALHSGGWDDDEVDGE